MMITGVLPDFSTRQAQGPRVKYGKVGFLIEVVITLTRPPAHKWAVSQTNTWQDNQTNKKYYL